MDPFKNLHATVVQPSRTLFASNPHYLFTILLAFILTLTLFFLSASDHHDFPSNTFSSHSHSHSHTAYTISSAPLSSPPVTLSRSTSTYAAHPPDIHGDPHDHLHSHGTSFADPPIPIPVADNHGDHHDHLHSCDVFDGRWIEDTGIEPLYKPGDCPFVDEAFSCFKNGRLDTDYLKLKWKPNACEIPRFDGLKMLDFLRGKRMVFVGDSLNRNMWESLVCAMREPLADKRNVFEVSGSRQFKSQGFYSIKFMDFNCSVDFIKSPFLVQEWKFLDKSGLRRETLRLDIMESNHKKYIDADIIVFNTGHWWTHKKTLQGNYYFQEGTHVYSKLKVSEAYNKALQTWAQWLDSNINPSKTTVFFRGYSTSHFRGGRWNTGGSCDGETKPISNKARMAPYPWMMRALESAVSKMKTPVYYLNVTRMTDYRIDGHPSIYRQADPTRRAVNSVQDCSHWCLPGVPDSWNQLLYAILIKSHKEISSV